MRFFKQISILYCFTFLFSLGALAQDSSYVQVHFLYGSKPYKKYRDTERPWFGGIFGGHVGVQGEGGQIIDFSFRGRFHVFSSRRNKHSAFSSNTGDEFYSIFGGEPDSMKRVIIKIPISNAQKQKFDSLTAAYLHSTPYDYAFLGMRCSAAAYDILGHIGLLPYYKPSKTYKKIFYPKILRKKLLKKAMENGWEILRTNGTAKRKWERD